MLNALFELKNLSVYNPDKNQTGKKVWHFTTYAEDQTYMTSSSDDDASNIDALDFLEYLMILYQMHRDANIRISK